jgi:hypothetical protein
MGSLPDLPHGSSPDLALVHPTREEELIQFNLNAVEWRGALSKEAYLRRENHLSKQDQTKDGGISYWILIDKSAKHNPLDPTSSARLPLASCETYRKKALVWQDGELKETICHGIGSVFCAPHLRGRKYAQRMMQELGEALKTYQTDEKTDCMFSVLFSDIGRVRMDFDKCKQMLTSAEILCQLWLGSLPVNTRLTTCGDGQGQGCGRSPICAAAP